MLVALNFEYSLGRPLPSAYLPHGPPSPGQHRAIRRLGWCAERLCACVDSKLRSINWKEELKGKRISYDGDELQTAMDMTLEQIVAGLPAAGVAASVDALSLATGEVRECLGDPARVLLRDEEIAPCQLRAKVWADDEN